MNNKENPEKQREDLKHKEIRHNPAGNLNDSFNRLTTGAFAEFVRKMRWAGLIFLIIISVVVLLTLLVFQ